MGSRFPFKEWKENLQGMEKPQAYELYNSFLIAFSMYSRIPAPKADWKKENMKYVMCFFPLVGAVIGILMGILWAVGIAIHLPRLLLAAFSVALPLALTGGIHLDGFLDTSDARHSCLAREEKLRIMDDPHTGAFALIAAGTWFCLELGGWSGITMKALPVMCLSFVSSRALSGYLVLTLPKAKDKGLNATFSDAAEKSLGQVVMLVYFLVCAIWMLLLRPVLEIVAMAAAVLTWFYVRKVAQKEFGGLTGDLAGYFLSLCEMVMVVAAAVACSI
jgi:adenosylcobinamide-GDP ribazoletransferase